MTQNGLLVSRSLTLLCWRLVSISPWEACSPHSSTHSSLPGFHGLQPFPPGSQCSPLQSPHFSWSCFSRPHPGSCPTYLTRLLNSPVAEGHTLSPMLPSSAEEGSPLLTPPLAEMPPFPWSSFSWVLQMVLLASSSWATGLLSPSKESSLHRAGCPLSFQEMHCPLSCWLFFHFEKTLLSQRLAGASS